MNDVCLNCNRDSVRVEDNDMAQDRVESRIGNTTFSPPDDIPCELLSHEQK